MQDELVISHGDPTELEEVQSLINAAYRGYVTRIGREPAPMRADHAASITQGNLFVARVESQIVGVLVLIPFPDHLLIENIAVRPDHHGRGVGTRMLTFAEQHARALHVGELRLYTNARMTENLDYYPRRGFVRTGRHTTQGFDRIHFSRTVSPDAAT